MSRIAMTVALLLAATQLFAGGRRRMVAASPFVETLAIAFVDVPANGSDALVDAGAMQWRPGRGRGAATVTRTFGIRIGAASDQPRGNATLRAYLQSPDPRCTIRVDGRPLGSAPLIVDAHAPIGIAVRHRVDIEVPPDVAPGAIATTIGWEVTTN